MKHDEYTDNEKKFSKQYTWDCPVKGHLTPQGKQYGGKSPIKFTTARKIGGYHMDEFHSELDRNLIIIRKWRPEDAKR